MVEIINHRVPRAAAAPASRTLMTIICDWFKEPRRRLYGSAALAVSSLHAAGTEVGGGAGRPVY